MSKTLLKLTDSIFTELRRDGVGYTVKRVFNHIPREGKMMPDEVIVQPHEGNCLYACSWSEWQRICTGAKSRTSLRGFIINDDGTVTRRSWL